MNNSDEFYDNLDKLEKYANLERSELGELCRSLIGLVGLRDYMGSEFAAALEKELSEQLKNFTDHAKIVERERTFRLYTYKELEWN